MKQNASYPLSAEQVSKILDISEFTVKKLAKAEQLPCLFINRRPFFNLEQLKKRFRTIEEAAV